MHEHKNFTIKSGARTTRYKIYPNQLNSLKGVEKLHRLKSQTMFSEASLDCKTVGIFAHSSAREQSNKRSGTRLKIESETGERRLFLSPHTPRA